MTPDLRSPFEKFIQDFKEDPIEAKYLFVKRIERVILDVCKKDNYYNHEDLVQPNYSEICDWIGAPDFQDGGMIEQCIDIALNTVLQIQGYCTEFNQKKV